MEEPRRNRPVEAEAEAEAEATADGYTGAEPEVTGPDEDVGKGTDDAGLSSEETEASGEAAEEPTAAEVLTEGAGIWAALCHLNLAAPFLIVASTGPAALSSPVWLALAVVICIAATAAVWTRKRASVDSYDQSMAFHAAQSCWWSGGALALMAAAWLLSLMGGVAGLVFSMLALVVLFAAAAVSVKAAYHTCFGDSYLYPLAGPLVCQRMLASLPALEDAEGEGVSDDESEDAEDNTGDSSHREAALARVAEIGGSLGRLLRPPRK